MFAATWKLEMTNNNIKQEIAVMKRLKHPNIVALHEVINDPSARKIYFIQEVASLRSQPSFSPSPHSLLLPR